MAGINNRDELLSRIKVFHDERNVLQGKEEEIKEYQINERLELLREIYKIFMEGYSETICNSLFLSEGFLFAAVKSYFDDVYRFKDYSGSMWIDPHKQAAYSIKWLTKFNPIQIKSESLPFTEEILRMNANYALFVGFTFLDSKILDNISDDYYNHLVYTLLFRNISGKSLASILYLLENIEPLKNK